MLKILQLIFISVFTLVIISCGPVDEKVEIVDGTELLYEKYKNMVTEGDGCTPCIDCASLALAITYNTQEEITVSKKNLIEYYNENGTIPCPELMPELKKDIALIIDIE